MNSKKVPARSSVLVPNFKDTFHIPFWGRWAQKIRDIRFALDQKESNWSDESPPRKFAVRSIDRESTIATLLQWVDVTREDAERLLSAIESHRREQGEKPISIHHLAQATGCLISDLHVALNVLTRLGLLFCESRLIHDRCKGVLHGPRDCCTMALCELFEDGPVVCSRCAAIVEDEEDVAIEAVFTPASHERGTILKGVVTKGLPGDSYGGLGASSPAASTFAKGDS